MRSIGRAIALSQTRQMGTQYNTWHIPHIAQKGSSPHDMSCPSKDITLCQSLIEELKESSYATPTLARYTRKLS